MLRATVLAILCLTLAGCARRDSPPSDLSLGDSDRVRQPQPPAKETAKPEEANSAEKDGVRLTVQAPKTAVAGKGLPVQMKIFNKGETTRFFHRETTDPTKLWIRVTMKEGKTVPFTLYGKKTYELTARGDARATKKELVSTIKLAAGQTHDLSVPNLALFYDLTVPGEYVLTINGFVQAEEGAKANKVQLQVDKVPFTITRGW